MKMMKKTPDRVSLSYEELESMSIDAIIRTKLNDAEKAMLREINKERQQERKQIFLNLKAEQEPILKDLRAIGLNVESVWSLVNMTENYSEAIPILLKHLVLPYSDTTKDGIARSLAVPSEEVRNAWPILVKLYREAEFGKGYVAPGDTKKYSLGFKDGMACALAVAVTDDTLPDLLDLVKDKSNGTSRVLLLSPLKKLRKKNPLVALVLQELMEDTDLVKEIASWTK